MIVFSASSFNVDPLLRVPSAGGASSPISTLQGSFPWFLPDGRHFLYQGSLDQVNTAAGSIIRVGSLDGSPSKTVGLGSNPLYAQGHLLFLREDTLMAQPFDTERLVTTGEGVPVAENVQRVLNSGRVGAFSVSNTGLLVYREGAGARGRVLTWFDRGGKQGTSVGDPADISQAGVQFSPDRKSVAAVMGGPRRGTDIWIYDISRALPTRFTFDAAIDRDPVWSPDGRSIVFGSNRKGRFDLYRKAVDSVGAEELLYADDLNKHPTSWSADGKLLLYDAFSPNSKTGADLWALPLTPERPGAALKPFLVLQTAFNESEGRFSPDGRWIAYQSNESQRSGIYVAPFPPAPSGPSEKRQVSTAGATLFAPPRWRQDGSEIFYVAPDGQLMAAEVAIKGATLAVGAVRPLFSLGNAFAAFDVSADGQRFLMLASPEQKSVEPLTLIQNWAAGLKK